MDTTTALIRHLEGLPSEWKWAALFSPMQPAFAAEWQTWLAAAQRAEEQSALTYWGHPGLRSAA